MADERKKDQIPHPQPQGQLIAKLKGHTTWVYGVPITSDGKLASVSGREIRLWDIESQTLETTLKGHSDIIFSLVLSPDGQTLASGSSDKTVRLWNLNNKQQICTLAMRKDPIHSVAFSPDGQILASGGDKPYVTKNGPKRTINLWDIASQQAITTLSAHDLRINTLAFSPDGKTLASGSNDNTVRLWDIASVQQLNIFEGHTKKVAAVSFTADGQHLISSGGGGIKIWNLRTGQVQNFVEEHGYISCFAIHPDGKTIAFEVHIGVEIWNLEKREKSAFLDSKSPVSLSFSPDGNLLAVGDTSAFSDDSGSVKLWKLSNVIEIDAQGDTVDDPIIINESTSNSDSDTTGLVATMDVAAGDAAPPPTQDNTSNTGAVVVKTEDSVPALATSSADATATTATTGGPPALPNTAIIKDEDDLWSTPETPTANAAANYGTGTGANDVVPLVTPGIRIQQEEETDSQQHNNLTVFQRLERIDLQLTCPKKRQALAAMRAHERLRHHELEAGIVSHAGQSAHQRLLPIEQFYGCLDPACNCSRGSWFRGSWFSTVEISTSWAPSSSSLRAAAFFLFSAAAFFLAFKWRVLTIVSVSDSDDSNCSLWW